MSRFFSGSNDEIQFTASIPVQNIPTTAATYAVIFRTTATLPTASFQSLIALHTSGGVVSSALEINNTSPARVYYTEPGAINARPTNSTNENFTASEWVMALWRKAAGSGLAAFEYSVYKFTGATMVQAAAAGSTGTPGASAPSIDGGFISIGEFAGADDYTGQVAVAALYDYQLTTTQASELVANFRTSDWWNCSGGQPVWLVELNGPVGTPVVDLTGYGGNQVAITGTTQDTGNDPPGWSYNGRGDANTPIPDGVVRHTPTRNARFA